MSDTLRALLDAEWSQAVEPVFNGDQDPRFKMSVNDNVYWCFRYDGRAAQGREKMTPRELDQLWQRLVDAMDEYQDGIWERQIGNVMAKSFILKFSPGDHLDEETCLTKAVGLLQRIGQRPHHMKSDTFGLDDAPELEQSLSPIPNTLELRMALAVVVIPSGCLSVVSCLQDLVNILSELADVGLEDASVFDDVDDSLRAYVRSTYFCVLKLYLWYIVMHHVTAGYDAGWDRFLMLKPNVEIDRRSRLYTRTNIKIPRYMCNWAFRLLRYNRASFALDFRHLFFRFRSLHDNRDARCLGNDPWNSCTGLHPLSCGRFQDKSLVLPEQSVHTSVCNRYTCHRMKWNMRSYDALNGCARAVQVTSAENSKTRVTYIGSSNCTMAISHVWSHGHGGRPAMGMNRCLHHRFSEIATRAGCDSYWIDTLSIPEDHTRRQEAIHHINDTFFRARMVLILDRDIMGISIANVEGEDGKAVPYNSSNIPIPLLESVIATFLVCDWNVRAWTMLEALKGCGNLHLLCQDGHTLPLQACLRRLCDEGNIDMVTLLLAAQHLFPVAGNAQDPPSRGLDAAAAALTYRHATRTGDEMVIWSLMTNMTPQTEAVNFWKSMVGHQIRTGFLISTIKRLRRTPGFSWAPATPYMRWWEGPLDRPPKNSRWDHRILPSDGIGSRAATITERGLQGEWLFYRVRPEADYEKAYSKTRYDLSGNPCLRVAACVTSWAPHVALLDAAAEDSAESYQGRPVVDSFETLRDGFAIIWSEDGETWHWYGVFAWLRTPGDEPLTMTLKEILIE